MTGVNSIEWAWPWVFFLLPLPVLAYLLLPRATVVLQRALRVPDVTPYESLASGQAKTGRGIISALLLLLMWACLIFAAARPQSFGEPLGVPITGRDLMLCIDISGSMNETDLYSGNLPATRMSVVKNVAQDFVSRRAGDRIGLIMFGTKAYVQSPLTHDHESVQHFLSEARVGLAGRSTAIGDAIGLGVKRLRERPAEARVPMAKTLKVLLTLWKLPGWQQTTTFVFIPSVLGLNPVEVFLDARWVCKTVSSMKQRLKPSRNRPVVSISGLATNRNLNKSIDPLICSNQQTWMILNSGHYVNCLPGR